MDSPVTYPRSSGHLERQHGHRDHVEHRPCDDTGACTHSGSYMDAMTNAKKTVRMTSRDEGPQREVHEFFEKGPDGQEFKSMELIYTRR
jgi:hypothetical protein